MLQYILVFLLQEKEKAPLKQAQWGFRNTGKY